jgi:hypothetical protein
VIRWRETERFGHAEVFAVIALASFLAARFLPVLEAGFLCPLRGLLGIPCATCGMTRAFVFLAHGDVTAAFRASPLGALLAAFAWLYAAADLARAALRAPFPEPSPRAARGLVAGLVVAAAVNWAYLVVRELGT